MLGEFAGGLLGGSGAFAGGGGFDVEPATIAAGSGPLMDASSTSSAGGLSDSLATEAGAAAAGAGPLAGELEALGAKLNADSGQLGVSLSETAAVLEATAQAYLKSDEPLVGAP